ncbi:N-acetylmuramoyl-L-alanine amidase [Streptomyces sp. NPDC096538]|uniref:peptidoglycan recognition protein family protein n=1 Tax=Streptomyces sp. NPDC096538 TaxID=3155427 RepID=UPI00331BD78C
MSTTPLTPDQWLRILRAEGVRVEEYPGWRTRERDAATGKAFGPVRMFLNHHTAGRNAKDVVAKNGVAGLPAPLAHVYLARSGVATMCSAGRANHAGAMAVNAYASFRDEKSTHPAPSKASGTVDGNDVSYGVETENEGDGKDVYPRKQYDAWVRINAAVCRFHGWTADSVGCHKETSVEGKVDPRGPVEGYGSRGRFEFTPKQFRADVAERLKHPATWSPGTTAPAKPTPTPPKEDDMALTPYDVWAYKGRGTKLDERDAYAYLRNTEAKVTELTEQVAELTATVAQLAEQLANTTPQG